MKRKDLEKKVEKLEEIIREQQLVIEQLRLDLNNQRYTPTYPIPLDKRNPLKPPFIVECEHEYPNPWHSINPAPCKKCGKLSEHNPIVWSDNTGNPPWDFKKHGGNVMNSPNMIDLDSSTTNSKINSDISGIN